MSEDSKSKALTTAANVLTYQNRSAQALYDRLLEKQIAEEDAAYAVSRLIELGFLNDEQYASDLIAQYRAPGWGKTRIKQELRKKKLEPDLIEALLEDFEPDYDKMQRLIAAKLRGETDPDRATLKRVSDSLARKGFTWEQIRRALDQYTEQLEEFES